MPNKLLFKRLRESVCERWLLLMLFLFCFILIVLCKFSRFQIYENWSSEIIDIINETMFVLACSYISSYVFYLLTILYPKAERAVSILDIAKEDIRYAKDYLGGFFMNYGGRYDVSTMSNEELFVCLTNKNDHQIYNIKEIEWTSLHKTIRQIKDLLLFIKAESEYLDSTNLRRLKQLEETLRNSDCILSEHIINECGVQKETTNLCMIDTDKSISSTICYDTLSKLTDNIKKTH